MNKLVKSWGVEDEWTRTVDALCGGENGYW